METRYRYKKTSILWGGMGVVLPFPIQFVAQDLADKYLPQDNIWLFNYIAVGLLVLFNGAKFIRLFLNKAKQIVQSNIIDGTFKTPERAFVGVKKDIVDNIRSIYEYEHSQGRCLTKELVKSYLLEYVENNKETIKAIYQEKALPHINTIENIWNFLEPELKEFWGVVNE